MKDVNMAGVRGTEEPFPRLGTFRLIRGMEWVLRIARFTGAHPLSLSSSRHKNKVVANNENLLVPAEYTFGWTSRNTLAGMFISIIVAICGVMYCISITTTANGAVDYIGCFAHLVSDFLLSLAMIASCIVNTPKVTTNFQSDQ